ncbi:DUF1963 domain-containing protein [Chitinophaga sp.]|uniref:DUF1963 domain-containing protein n=1 Tax=Chitinophaga sp. TaxID=1869181 RepID=UPI002634C099|nr:DUF1963 domain-containing protein [uncultured Chitinophaga sp.]
MQKARNYVESFALPASVAEFGKENEGNYADKKARGWYYDGEASRPFHRLTADVLAASLHCFIAVSESRAGEESDLPPGASKIKGLPHLPPGFGWPAGALFLAQFNLEDLAPQDIQQLLPATGMMYFFFNPNTATGTVYYYTGALDILSLRPYPESGNDSLGYFLEEYRDRRYQATFRKKAAFCIDDILEQLPDMLKNEVSGMLDCPLASRAIGDNLFGQPGYWQGENEIIGDKQMEEEADVLLFQYEFGEGHIHFWVSAAELEARDFSKVWLSYSGT